jgi:hypothetical protein
VTRKKSTIVGLLILLFYLAISAVLIYFKFSFMKFLLSILAFFSLTVSYLMPTIYKIRLRKAGLQGKKSLLPGMTIQSDIGIDLDLKGTHKMSVEHKNKIMEDYFAAHRDPQDQPRSSNTKSTTSHIFSDLMSFLLVVLFLGFYVLIFYNFVYHILKE